MTDLLKVKGWLPEGWAFDKKGNKLMCGLAPGDLCKMLRKQFGTRLRWNELLLQPELNGHPILGTALEKLYVALSERRWRIAQKPAEDAVLRVAQENRFHPVAEYLETLLPPDIRESLWPFLDDGHKPRPTSGDRQQILAKLLESNASIEINLEELRKQFREDDDG